MTHHSKSTHTNGNRPARARASQRPASRRLRIVVADHQTIDRRGIVGLLSSQSDFEVVGEAGTIEDTMRACAALHPDLLILTLHVGLDGERPPIPAIRSVLPSLRILGISERGYDACLVLNPPGQRLLKTDVRPRCMSATDCLTLAISQGAAGTIRRDAEPTELYEAVRAVAAGGTWHAPGTALPSAANGTEAGLSERELEVAALIADGLSNKEISTALKISEPTVKKHVGHILEKLGLEDRLQAGLFVARNPLTLRRS
ncbi:MAG: LuxR C-terminal-related transcriptional regulator [Candidatus Eiseniibacteriota bacterium]